MQLEHKDARLHAAESGDLEHADADQPIPADWRDQLAAIRDDMDDNA